MGEIIRNGVTYSGSVSQASDVIYNNTSSQLPSSSVQGAIDTIYAMMPVFQQTLTAGQTTITYTDANINTDACFDWYADKDHSDLFPSDWSISGTTLTVTYEAQTEDVAVGVQIMRGVVIS